MITITLDTHLDITPPDLRTIADRLELGYTTGTLPYNYDIVHENYSMIIKTLEGTIDDLNDTIDTRNGTIDELRSDIKDNLKEITKLTSAIGLIRF